jgi:hypothetical protein
MRSVRLLITAMACALSLGVVMLPAGIQGSGQPVAGIQGTGAVVVAPQTGN